MVIIINIKFNIFKYYFLFIFIKNDTINIMNLLKEKLKKINIYFILEINF